MPLVQRELQALLELQVPLAQRVRRVQQDLQGQLVSPVQLVTLEKLVQLVIQDLPDQRAQPVLQEPPVQPVQA